MIVTHEENIYDYWYRFEVTDIGIDVSTEIKNSINRCGLGFMEWSVLSIIAEHYHDSIMKGERPRSMHDYIMRLLDKE